MNVHDFRGLLRKDGWQWLRTKGSHEMWRKGQRTERWTPGGLGSGHNEISGGLLKELVRRFGLENVIADSGRTRSESPQPRHRFSQGEKKAEPGTFGRRLLEARTASGLTQTSLAKLIGNELKLKPATIQVSLSSWERGDSSPFKAGTTELRTKTIGGRATATSAMIGIIAELFGFNDLSHYKVLKSASQQLSEIEVEPEHFETVITEVHKQIPDILPESRSMSVIEDLEGEKVTLQMVDNLRDAGAKVTLAKPTPDEKEFIKIIHASDVMQWIMNQDNEIRKLRKEINDLRRSGEATAELREKARKYDEIQRLLGK